MTKIPVPTQAEIDLWEKKLNMPVIQVSFLPRVQDGNGVPKPAQPVKNGDLRWRQRIFTYDQAQDRKKRHKTKHVCPACGDAFEATKRAICCSRVCTDQIKYARKKKRLEECSTKITDNR